MATDWESRYVAGDTPWDKGAPSPALLEVLARGAWQGAVLVPGCGAGHDVRAIAASCPAARVLGADLAPSAVEMAGAFPRAGAETYERADFLAPPPAWAGAFDVLWEHTLFCAIDPSERPAYAASAAAVLKPGALYAAVFYMDPGHEDGPPFPSRRGELDALFGSFFTVLAEWVPASAYPGREGRELIRLHRRV